jgi:hypothetical protein
LETVKDRNSLVDVILHIGVRGSGKQARRE